MAMAAELGTRRLREVFPHIRIVMGMVIGSRVGTALVASGVRMVQDREATGAYRLHLACWLKRLPMLSGR